MIESESRGDISILRMQHGKVNALDLEFCRELSATLAGFARRDVRGVILTGSGRVFSAGVDLHRILNESPDYLDEFLPALSKCFRDVFTFPKPLVAAINGHAVAGGCIVAAGCDQRLIHDKARIGIPELRVGVPLPSIAIEMIRTVAAVNAFQTMVTVGKNYRGQEAIDVGLADEMVTVDKLMSLAEERLRSLMEIPGEVFELTKLQIRKPALDHADANDQELGERIRELWRSDGIRKVIESFVSERL